MFGPLHYEANYAYPLIVWLHGPGDSEQQLKRIMPMISLRNYVAVAARGTAESSGGGFHWRQSDEHIQAADERVAECIEAASQRFNVASHRVFLAGYGCGGTMAFRMALNNPRDVAGVLSFGGPLPTGRAPLAQLQAARRLAVFVTCTRESKLSHADRMRRFAVATHCRHVDRAARVSWRRRPDGPHASGHGPLGDGTNHLDRIAAERRSPQRGITASSGTGYIPAQEWAYPWA